MKNGRSGFTPIPGFVPLQEICSSKSDCRHVQSAGLVGAVCDQLLIYATFIMWPSGRLSGCRKYLGIGMKPDLPFFFVFFLRTIVETCCNRVDSFHSKPFSCVVGTCTKLEVINKHCPFSFALMTCNMGKLLHSTSIRKYYWHNTKYKKILQRSQLCHQGRFWHLSIGARRHGSVVRIFVVLSWELYCQWKSKQTLEQWQPMGRQKRS